ncbi:rhamnogalacturonan lyase [Calycomorphotria hydatis]|uniref:rhamnogalacturonan lyase n=1 Tax=Calycomorphotria hydatis TaxID=2528027 RepID=UPI0018D25367|nr:rhamnogalacturonan lyase [Calycomorphotria hydatis]
MWSAIGIGGGLCVGLAAFFLVTGLKQTADYTVVSPGDYTAELNASYLPTTEGDENVEAIASELPDSPTAQEKASPQSDAADDKGVKLVEKLDRGLVAVPKSGDSVLLSWRFLGLDPESIRFDLYRTESGGKPVKLNSAPLYETNFIDNDWDSTRETTWRVVPNINESELGQGSHCTLTANTPAWPMISIPLNRPSGGECLDHSHYDYTANDATVADLDGDGDYEIILRWEPTKSWGGGGHNGPTGPVLIDAYTLEGEHLWRINLGHNINASAHITQMTAFDLNSDGRAEVALQTADGTVDGLGNVIGEEQADHRRDDGVVLSGPEYLTIFDGLSGAELETKLFIPQRHPQTHSPTPDQIWDIWGDNYGNRMNRFGACVAYLDGRHPHLITTRGYYGGHKGRGGRTCIAAWIWRDGELNNVWTFDTLGHPELAGYIGQGNHQVSVADLDNDGCDEIVYGACAIDNDGTGLYTTGLGHGDTLHVTDMDPERPGIEVFTVHEGTGHDAGMEFRAADGTAIWKKFPHADVGRGVAFDIDPNSPGFEFWSSASDKIYDIHGNSIANKRPRWTNMGIWWDGDLSREILDGTVIDKWDPVKHENRRLLTAYKKPYLGSKNNSTKSTPCLVADVVGDWREELILRSQDNNRLMIIMSNHPSEIRLRTLMHDPHYRVSVDWQNVGYNQPPHTGFYLGTGMPLPQPAYKIKYVEN